MNSIEGLAIFTENTQNDAIVDNAVFTESAINGPSGVVEFATLQDAAVNEGTLDVAVFNNTATNAAGGIVVTQATFDNSAVSFGTIQGDAIFRGTSELQGEVQGNTVLLESSVIGAPAVINGPAIVASTVTVSPQATFNVIPTTHYAPTFAPYPSATYVYLITSFNDTFYTNASGTNVENFVYVWYKDGNIIQNASTSSLQLTSLGAYKVTITNEYGEYLESSTVSVSGLGGHTSITLQPQSSSLFALQYVLSAASTGTAPVDTIWYDKSGQALAAGNTLTVESISGEYIYVASTLYETVTSSTASVSLTALNNFYSVKFNYGYLYKTATTNHLLSSNDFTIEAWVKPESSQVHNPVVVLINTANGALGGAGFGNITGWKLTTDTYGNLRFDYSGTSNTISNSVTTTKQLLAGKWQHIAVTRSNQNIRIFHNGVLITEKTLTTPLAQSINQNIKLLCGYDALGYNGRITDLRIITGQALYTSNFVIPYAKLTSTGYGDVNQNITGTVLELDLQTATLSNNWTRSTQTFISPDSNWYLDDAAQLTNLTGSGNDVQGRSGLDYVDGILTVHEHNVNAYYPYNKLWYSDNNLTTSTALHIGRNVNALAVSGDFISNNKHYNVNSSGLVTGVTAPSATAIFSKVFNAGNYIKARMSDIIGTGDFTFEAFAKPGNLGYSQWIFDIGQSNDSLPYNGLALQFRSGDRIAVTIDNYFELTGPLLTTLSTDKWYHVAVVRSGTTVSLYVDGIRWSQITSSYSLTKQNITIGAFNNNSTQNSWRGNITNLRVSKVARYSGVYFDSDSTPFITDSDTLLLILQTNSLEGYNTPTGTVGSSPLSPWYLDKAAADTNFTGTGNGTTVGQYGLVYIDGILIKHAYAQFVSYIVSEVYTPTTTWTDTLSIQENNTLYANKHDNTTVNNKYFTCNNTWYATNSSGVVSLSTTPWYADSSSYSGSTYSRNGNFNLVNEGNGVLVADHSSSGSLTVFNETAFDHGHNDFTMEYFTKISGWANGIDGADWSTGSHYPSPYFRFSYGPYNSRSVAVVIWDNEFASLPYSQDGINAFVVQFNQWYHMAFTRQGNVFRLYVNGVKVGEKTWNITLDDEAISKTIFGGNDMYNQFAIGRMTAIRVVKGTALYTTDKFAVPTTVPTNISGTSLLLTFGATAVPDTTLTTDIFDESESRHLPAIGGGNWYGSNTITQSDEGNGVKTAVFNGASYIEYADTTTDFVMGSGSFTVELFVKPSNVSAGDYTYITTAAPNDFQGFYLGQNTAQSEALLGNGSSPWSYIPDIPAVTLTAGQWHHVALVKNNTNATLYVNGVNKGSMTYGSIGSNNNILSIGGRSNQGGQYFTGKMAGIRIVKGTAVYTSNFIPPTTLLTAISGTKLLLNFGATAVPAIG